MIISLPVEILLRIFTFVTKSDLESLELTCRRFSEVIVQYWWKRDVDKILESDDCYAKACLLSCGLSVDSHNETSTIRKAYLSYLKAWREKWMEEGMKQKSFPLYNCKGDVYPRKKVCKILPFEDKIYLFLHGGAIDLWKLNEHQSITFKKTLYEPDDTMTEEAPFAACCDFIATVTSDFKTVVILSGSKEKVVGKVKNPSETQILALALGKDNLALLTLRQVIVFTQHKSSCGNAVWRHLSNFETLPNSQVPPDSSRSFYDYSLSLSKTSIALAFTTCVAEPTDSLDEAAIHGYGLQSLKRTFAYQAGGEIFGVAVSDNDVVAFLETMNQKSSVKLYSLLSSQHLLYEIQVPYPPFSKVTLPVQWVDDRLFLKSVPNNNEAGDGASLVGVDFKDDVIFPIKSIPIQGGRNILHISRFRLLAVTHEIRLDDEFHISLVEYNVWS